MSKRGPMVTCQPNKRIIGARHPTYNPSKKLSSEAQGNNLPLPPPPPPGYPRAVGVESPKPEGKKMFSRRTKKKGERGFIEGCLFALCCCWLCEECCL